MSTLRESREHSPEHIRDPAHSKEGSKDSPTQNRAHPWRSKNPFDSFRHAAEGVVHTVRTQRNMRFHMVTLSLVLLSGLLFRLQPVEMLILLFTITLVLIAEMFNTAIEVVVDMITQSYHPAAKFAKDIAAGAVLIASVNAVVVGFVLFLWNGRPEELRLRLQSPPTLYVFLIGFLLLLILLVVGKVFGEKGTLLQGGVVSGHAAIAFFLATTVVFVAGNIFASCLAILLALLVAQARVEARFHTVREVVLGAALGLFLSASAYQIPVWFRQIMGQPATPVSVTQIQGSTPALLSAPR